MALSQVTDAGSDAGEATNGLNRTQLRGLGQRLEASIKIGKDGLTPAVIAELRRQLAATALVKIRYLQADRHERAALSLALEKETGFDCVGQVGHTALFHRRPPAAGPS